MLSGNTRVPGSVICVTPCAAHTPAIRPSRKVACSFIVSPLWRAHCVEIGEPDIIGLTQLKGISVDQLASEDGVTAQRVQTQSFGQAFALGNGERDAAVDF